MYYLIEEINDDKQFVRKNLENEVLNFVKYSNEDVQRYFSAGAS